MAWRHPPLWVRLAVAVVLSVGFALVAGPIVKNHASASAFLRQMAMPFAMLVLVLLVAMRHESRWRRTTAKLADLLDDARRGRGGERTAREMDELIGSVADNRELSRLARAVNRLTTEARDRQRRVRDLEIECERKVTRTADQLTHEIGVLKTRAGRDGLTGLGNRRALDEALPQRLAAARKTGRNLSVVMIDVDHFKPLNDTLGHAAGDGVLKDIAKLIRSAVRENDAAFRYGGDEFVLLLADADVRQARGMADRLSRLADTLGQGLAVAKKPGLSCGVANLSDLPTHAESADLLAAADADVYRVKRKRKSMRIAA